MINAAIHQADASFQDGFVTTGGTTLNSPTATFTQADVGCRIVGHGYRKNTQIASWINPTQVTIHPSLTSGSGNRFTIKARRDGLIDVAMAAFPSQYISTAVGSNGSDLDACAANQYGDPDPGTYLARTVDTMAWRTYGNRYIVQRNNVSAIIPTIDEAAGTAWVILADAASLGRPTAGQALSNCFNDSTYQMNGGTNCMPNCTPSPTPCTDACAITYQEELDFSGDHIFTYCANYYEVYFLDADNLSLDYLHGLFTGVGCPTPTPTPPVTPTATPPPTPTPQC
jgi:hypothetical protein